MKYFILKKIFELFMTLLLSSILLFSMVRLSPGDPIKSLLRNSEYALVEDEAFNERYAQLKKEYQLDDSIFKQYLNWSRKLIAFDLGKSIHTDTPIVEELKRRLPITLLLSFLTLLIQILLGVSLGIVSSIKNGKILDNIIRIFCIILTSMPLFALGLFLIYIFGIKFNLYTISGKISLKSFWLPVVTLSLTVSPSLIRLIRSGMLDEFGKLYISASLSRGLTKAQIIKNAFLNILLPITTMIVYSLISLIGGAVIVENVFSLPGIGNYALESVLLHDYPVIQAYGFFLILFIVIINFFTEILHIFINPQLKYRRNTNDI